MQDFIKLLKQEFLYQLVWFTNPFSSNKKQQNCMHPVEPGDIAISDRNVNCTCSVMFVGTSIHKTSHIAVASKIQLSSIQTKSEISKYKEFGRYESIYLI